MTHPNICTLHDVGVEEGIEFLVMELLDGETLAARIERGPLPMSEVLAYAMQIADALDAAHGQGIVHRDLKPSNVMLTRTGAKLLDFGLAKLRADHALSEDGVTEVMPLTARGQVLGTVAYMAPEQLAGQPIDQRADIFAFGAIVFEMLTGKRASTTQVMAGAPPALERLVTVCLSKDPEQRWSSAHDVLLQLRSIAESPPVTAEVAARRDSGRERLAWIVAAIAIAAALVLAAVWQAGRGMRSRPEAALDVLSILPDEQTTLERGEAPQVSPDGRRVAFVATDTVGRSGLYVRSLDSLIARLLPDTDAASLPFWSPDSRQLGFFAQGQLKTVALSGGSPHTIAAAPVPRGGTWSHDDVILFSAVPNLALRRVPAGGGQAVDVPMPPAGQFRLLPRFLPDGRHYLYLDPRTLNGSSFVISVASVDSTESKELLRSSGAATYASGYLLFRRDAALMAQPFDVRTLQLSGTPAPIAEDAGVNPLTYQALFSASDGGQLAYRRLGTGSQLTWFDRSGKSLGTAGPPGDYNTLCLTADDKRIVYDVADPVTGAVDIWMFDIAGARSSRLTFAPEVDFYPVCSPSGEEVVFSSLREGPPNLFRLSLGAPGSERAVLRSPSPKIATDWSREGQLIYTALNQKTGADIEMAPLSGSASKAVVATAAQEANARLSPDGRWIAYNSNDSGRFEVYVQPFPTTGAKWQISKGGGQGAQWRRDGRELFYVAPDLKLVGVAVSAGSDFAAGEARTLFETRITSLERSNFGSGYAVTSDGQKFLVNTAPSTIQPVTLILNWAAALGKPAQ